MLSQGELAARATQTIDDFDGHDVGRSHRLSALRQVTSHDFIQVQPVPKPSRQPHVAEAAGVGPAHRAQTCASCRPCTACRVAKTWSPPAMPPSMTRRPTINQEARSSLHDPSPVSTTKNPVIYRGSTLGTPRKSPHFFPNCATSASDYGLSPTRLPNFSDGRAPASAPRVCAARLLPCATCAGCNGHDRAAQLVGVVENPRSFGDEFLGLPGPVVAC